MLFVSENLSGRVKTTSFGNGTGIADIVLEQEYRLYYSYLLDMRIYDIVYITVNSTILYSTIHQLYNIV